VKGARTLEDVNDKKSFARKIRSRSMLLGDGTQKTCPAECRMRANSKIDPCLIFKTVRALTIFDAVIVIAKK
jgi:hypothetical protein